jgi:nucleotide-binding universal stress UspA family protein
MMHSNAVYQHVVVGIDGSSEGIAAAIAGWRIAQGVGARYSLIHATRDYLVKAGRAISAAAASVSSSAGPVPDTAIVEATRAWIASSLADLLPPDVKPAIHVERGRAGTVIGRFAAEAGADLILVGGKHHSAIERWLGGSTAYFLAGTAAVPVLVTRNLPEQPGRILVSSDLSEHAPTVLNAAERLATALHAAVRVVHVVEPVEGASGTPDTESNQDRLRNARAILGSSLIPKHAHAGTEHHVVLGDPWTMIREEISRWDADILVLGSHGDGFQHRHLLGRVTEAFLRDLPTSVLIVPLGDVAKLRTRD